MEARFSRPGVRWVFLAGVFAVAGALAFSYYPRALALDPRSANTWMDLAGAREAQGDTAQAREAFEQAQKAHPISADVAWRYANFLLRQAEMHPRIELKMVFPLLDELFVEDFIPEARSVWGQAVEMAGITPSAPSDGSLVWDGGFEGDFIPGGFGWRWRPDPGVQFTFDRETKHSGDRSLRITFDGVENLNFTHLFQYVPVQPGKTYQYSAYVKTEEITTNRGPCFAVFDSRNPGATGRLTPDLTGTQPWTRLELSFTAGSDTRLVTVVLRRIPSEKLDNKLRGTVWVDDVSVVPLEPGPKRPAP